MSARVAIVGTGIAGSTAAYRVAEAGLDPIVFERGAEHPCAAN